MITFAAAVFFLLITPGPGVLSVAGVGSSFGYRPGAWFIFGLCAGTNAVAAVVVSGLAAAVLAYDGVRTVLFFASFGYLLYLAARIALAGSRIAFIEKARPPGFRDALILQALNPKAYAVNTALFTGFPLGVGYGAEVAIKFVVINAIWIPIHFLWLWAGVGLRRLDLPAPVQRAINVAMAASMVAVVVLAALSYQS